jgi:hypothetical protein
MIGSSSAVGFLGEALTPIVIDAVVSDTVKVDETKPTVMGSRVDVACCAGTAKAGAGGDIAPL